jgi:hypothetical protein
VLYTGGVAVVAGLLQIKVRVYDVTLSLRLDSTTDFMECAAGPSDNSAYRSPFLFFLSTPVVNETGPRALFVIDLS